MTNWNIIYGHKWPDKLYETAVTYLKHGTLSDTPLWVRRTFLKRLSAGYTLNDQDEIVLIVNTVPWVLNRNNRLPIATPDERRTFKVVKESDRADVLIRLIGDPKNLMLSAHMMFDKVIRAYYIGISRRYIHTFLTTHPYMRDLNIHRALPKKTIVKSFRPEYPFQHWQMDLIDMSTVSSANKGYNWIFVIIDIFSKFVYLYPLGQKTGANVAILLSKLFLSGDIPGILHSDNGLEFRNEDVAQVCAEFNVKQIFGKGYSPQTQGFVENKNKHLKSLLNYFFIKHNSYQYYDLLDRFAYNINNAKHSVTGYTPMQLHRGRDVSVGGGPITPANDPANETSKETVILEEPDEARLEAYYKHTHNMYNERVNHVSTILKSEAVKREVMYAKRIQSQQSTAGIRVGSYVRVATFVDAGNHEIQPVIIQIDGVKQVNPLLIKRNDTYVHVADVVTRPRTVFRKIDLNTRRFYPQVFKVTHVIRESGRVRTTYRLAEVDEHNATNVTTKPVAMLQATGKSDSSWSFDFQTPSLALYNPYDSSSNVAAPRPQYRFVDTMDMKINHDTNLVNTNNKKQTADTNMPIFAKPSDVISSPNNRNNNNKAVSIEQVERALSRRKCLVRRYIVYNKPHVDEESGQYTGKVRKDLGQIVKWDANTHNWQIRFSEQRGTGEATRLLLQPALYGKMDTIDGWTFEDERGVFRKCK